jgi:hypothetical protein
MCIRSAYHQQKTIRALQALGLDLDPPFPTQAQIKTAWLRLQSSNTHPDKPGGNVEVGFRALTPHEAYKYLTKQRLDRLA